MKSPGTGVQAGMACLLASLFLVFCRPAAAPAQERPGAELLIRLEGQGVPGPADLDVLVDGRPAVVTGVSGVQEEELPVLVYVDHALTGRAGLEGALQALEEAAETVTALGPVEVSGELPPLTLPENREASRSPETLRELLRYVLEETGSAGDLRQDLWEPDSPENADTQSRLVSSALNLGAATALGGSSRPRLLVLIRDGIPGESVGERGKGVHQELARAVASLGWTTLVMAPSGSVSSGGFLGQLAAASGGEVIREPEELASALGRIQELWRLGFDLPSDLPEGQPAPLLVRSRRGALAPLAPGWVGQGTPEILALARAERVLSTGESSGDLDVLSTFFLQDSQSDGVTCVVDASLPLTRALRKGARFRASVAGPLLDGSALLTHASQNEGDLAGTTLWVLRTTLELAEEPRELALVIEDMSSGLWGGTLVRAADPTAVPSGSGVLVRQARISLLEVEDEPEGVRDAPFRLLPPKSQPARGKQKIRTVVADPGIHHVVFLLDGNEVGRDEKAPFTVEVDLGTGAEPHTVTATAYDEHDHPLGDDKIELNQPARSFRVSIESVAVTSDGKAADVVAVVSTPPGARLDRLEFYGNETLATTRKEGPFQVRVPLAGIQGADFVRVVAYLEDGTSMEDVSLLMPGFVDEEVEVNLVEVYVVVTDKEGVPVQDLSAEDFELRRGRKPQTIDLFAPGDERDLSLGLVIDTSESMAPIIIETKRAASRFVQDTLREGDRAFLVDFDTRPRLALGMTEDLLDLVRALGYLQADGFTAMWDAILFGLRELGDEPGRKALVLLTDGDDYKSKHRVSRVIDDARRQGVPVYILALAGLDGLRPSFKKMDLDAIAKQTGGRVFYINHRDELGSAYARINQELRSQVILAFAAPRDLTQDELLNLDVRIKKPGLEVRSVASGRALR